MSIPLDRLYYYIEDIARDIRGDALIYQFFPHGSKKLEDVQPLRNFDQAEIITGIQIFCYDQEPLMFDYYSSSPILHAGPHKQTFEFIFSKLEYTPMNLRSAAVTANNIWDRAILLHSEQRSADVVKYQNHQFIPVYYWSHALIARDWFRYAQHQCRTQTTANQKLFLIYNRAWSGTREYRLKFGDLLIDQRLVDYCKTTLNTIDPETQQHYCNYKFKKTEFQPVNTLENYFLPNEHPSSSSADFDLNDYSECAMEVVLETLFDDQRLHLTEKTLRPIACRKPFILCGPQGSLEYLKSYGFKTFGEIIDESYDQITDSVDRLKTVVSLMKEISQWPSELKQSNFKAMQEIADHNHNHFFSKNFFDTVTNELKHNLEQGLTQLVDTNTSSTFINFRKSKAKHQFLKDVMTGNTPFLAKQDVIKILTQARKYYNKRQNK